MGGGAVFLAAGAEENAGDKDGNDDRYDDEWGSDVHEEVSLRSEYQTARTGAQRGKNWHWESTNVSAAFRVQPWHWGATVAEKAW